MNFKWVIHDKYNGFLSRQDVVCFTSNIPGAKKFLTQDEAIAHARKLMADGKLSEIADILALPLNGGEIRK